MKTKSAILLALFALAGCATTSAADPTDAAIVAPPSTDDSRCSREPVKDWKIEKINMGATHTLDGGRMIVIVDISPVEEDGSGGYLVSIGTISRQSEFQMTPIYIPPHATNKPMERFIRCLKGALEAAHEHKTMYPYGYYPPSPAPAAGSPKAKKGGK